MDDALNAYRWFREGSRGHAATVHGLRPLVMLLLSTANGCSALAPRRSPVLLSPTPQQVAGARVSVEEYLQALQSTDESRLISVVHPESSWQSEGGLRHFLVEKAFVDIRNGWKPLVESLVALGVKGSLDEDAARTMFARAGGGELALRQWPSWRSRLVFWELTFQKPDGSRATTKFKLVTVEDQGKWWVLSEPPVPSSFPQSE